jgi:hypothetical protein
MLALGGWEDEMRLGALSIIASAAIISAIVGCDDAMSPQPWSSFAGKELSLRTGPGCFSAAHGVVIFDDGTAHAMLPRGYDPDSLLPISRRLTTRERARITEIIKPFPTFKSYYPGECGTIPSLTVRLISDGSRRDVTLCAYSEGVPAELYSLVSELSRIEGSLMDQER